MPISIAECVEEDDDLIDDVTSDKEEVFCGLPREEEQDDGTLENSDDDELHDEEEDVAVNESIGNGSEIVRSPLIRDIRHMLKRRPHGCNFSRFFCDYS